MNSLGSAFLFFNLILLSSLSAQPTLGTLQNEAGSLQGYTFFSPFSGTKAWMVDNCGKLVNEWDRGTRPGLAAYFLDDGRVLRTFKPALNGPFTSASNAGGLELVDWENNTLWSYQINTTTQLSHHDAVYMPNGNILVLTWELVYTDELIERGRDPNEIAPEGFMWSERILELEPVGVNEANIVWEWNIKDHYIQDFDPAKLDFGVISEHPELFDINLPQLNSSNSNATRDWNHFNAIDYQPDLDQILISVRNSDEIWILDHSTTTAEAASHTGGRYGKGGDILYRWGNAAAYQRGVVSEQRLFGQHGVHWIREGLEDAGKILIFNNGNGRPGTDFSTVEILVPPQDSLGGYPISATESFGPSEPEWVYGDRPEDRFYSPYLSNAQRLSNGNTLINSGSEGRVFEIDKQKNKVWEYIIPLRGDFPLNQGQMANNNASFRAYKFAEDYSGFNNLNLVAGNTIENGANPLNCELLVEVKEITEPSSEISISYFPGNRMVSLFNPNMREIELSVFDIAGRKILTRQANAGLTVSLPAYCKGIYIVSAASSQDQIVRSIYCR